MLKGNGYAYRGGDCAEGEWILLQGRRLCGRGMDTLTGEAIVLRGMDTLTGEATVIKGNVYAYTGGCACSGWGRFC